MGQGKGKEAHGSELGEREGVQQEAVWGYAKTAKKSQKIAQGCLEGIKRERGEARVFEGEKITAGAGGDDGGWGRHLWGGNLAIKASYARLGEGLRGTTKQPPGEKSHKITPSQ